MEANMDIEKMISYRIHELRCCSLKFIWFMTSIVQVGNGEQKAYETKKHVRAMISSLWATATLFRQWLL